MRSSYLEILQVFFSDVLQLKCRETYGPETETLPSRVIESSFDLTGLYTVLFFPMQMLCVFIVPYTAQTSKKNP